MAWLAADPEQVSYNSTSGGIMYRQSWLFVLAIAAGVLIGALGVSTWSGSAPVPGSPAEIPALPSQGQSQQDLSALPDSDRAAIESLAKVLNAEIHERRVLAEQLEQIKAELMDLEQNLRVRVEEAFDIGSIRLATYRNPGTCRQIRR